MMQKLLAPLLVCIVACSATESGDRPALTREELLNPESCKDCHPKHYNEWSGSMHAYSIKDPVFRAMNKRGQEETNGALGEFCVNCHAPMAVRENAFNGDFANLDQVPEHLQGVTCYFCHNATAVSDEHVNGKVTLANDDTMRAALRAPLQPSTHKVAFSNLHDSGNVNSSLLCGTCHDVQTPAGAHVERTFQEYSGSIFSQQSTLAFASCQSCHMRAANRAQQAAESTGRPGETVPSARDLHEHFWPAVDVPLTDFPHADAMRSAVEGCKLQSSLSYFNVETRPPLWPITVSIETQAGHSQPSGAAQDRRMWVEIIAYDANDTELFRSGQVADGAVEETPEAPHPFMLRDRIYDASGQEIHMFWNAASTKPSLLVPSPIGGSLAPGSHTTTRSFNSPRVLSTPPARIDLQVRMRPMGLDILNDLVQSGHLTPDVVQRMPTLLVDSRRAVWDASKSRYQVEYLLQDGTCDTYPCMLDPTSSPKCQ